MLEKERHNLILKLVEERSIVSVGDLLDLLGASEATIRRDINALAERGEVKRIRGGAEAVRPRHQPHLVGMPFAMSQDVSVPQKRAIARAAAELIEPGESIIINGGTTTYALVEFLEDSDLDILTNSFPIAAKLFATSRNRITLPGGTIFREQNIVLSPFENDTIESFWGNKLFVGCYGLNRFGMMEADPLIVQAQTKLLKRSEHVIVMADSSKLRRKSAMIVAGLDRINTIVTDDGARPEELEGFRAAGIKALVAKVTGADEMKKRAGASRRGRVVTQDFRRGRLCRVAGCLWQGRTAAAGADASRHRREVTRQWFLRRRPQGRRRGRQGARCRRDLRRPDHADGGRADRDIELAHRAARRCDRRVRERSRCARADAEEGAGSRHQGGVVRLGRGGRRSQRAPGAIIRSAHR